MSERIDPFDGNYVAPDGMAWMCAACGKRSRDRYGEQKFDHGWDSSCTTNAVLIHDEDPPRAVHPNELPSR